MKKVQSNRVHRQWRREVHKLLTEHSLSLHSFLTELLTLSGSCEQQLTSGAQRAILKQRMDEVWSAVRLGYAGAKALTVITTDRRCRYLLRLAFKHGREKVELATQRHAAVA